jgi:Fe-S-cluster containining protein
VVIEGMDDSGHAAVGMRVLEIPNECAGVCCAGFTLSRTYAEIVEHMDTIPDGEYIVDMLIPLTADESALRSVRFGSKLYPPEREVFTCRHWNENTRRCGAYEQRPGMCRKFPYGDPCEHGCGFLVDPALLIEPEDQSSSTASPSSGE